MNPRSESVVEKVGVPREPSGREKFRCERGDNAKQSEAHDMTSDRRRKAERGTE